MRRSAFTAEAVACDAQSPAGDKAVWTLLPVSAAGQYFVSVRWNLLNGYVTNQKYTVYHDGGTTDFFGVVAATASGSRSTTLASVTRQPEKNYEKK